MANKNTDTEKPEKLVLVPEEKFEELMKILDDMVAPSIKMPARNNSYNGKSDVSEVKMLELVQQAYDKRSELLFRAREIVIGVKYKLKDEMDIRVRM